MKFQTEQEIAQDISNRIRAVRVSQKLTQKAISERSGVSLASYQRFEQTGRIEFLSLIKVAQALHLEGDFEGLFDRRNAMTLDQIEQQAQPTPRKGRVYKQS